MKVKLLQKKTKKLLTSKRTEDLTANLTAIAKAIKQSSVKFIANQQERKKLADNLKSPLNIQYLKRSRKYETRNLTLLATENELSAIYRRKAVRNYVLYMPIFAVVLLCRQYSGLESSSSL
uniref:Uncharacterized protein n=1 Tax=Glossina austeni TaxID=7395 RepID=A0A1A9UPS6_GLOAU